MVSMVETSHPEQNDTVMDPVVPKAEPVPDGSISSTVSTPDPEAEPLTQDPAQTQKRKGGRKPVRNTLLLGVARLHRIVMQESGAPQFFTSHFHVPVPTTFDIIFMITPPTDDCSRSMPPPRNVSSAIDRRRLLSESVAQSISASSRRLSSAMRSPCRACSRVTAARRMSV